MSRIWPVAVFAASLIVYVATLPPEVLPGDSGELIAASYTLGIAHPPGYPLYVMAGNLFSSVVRLGSVALRYNLLSAVFAALASGLVFLTTARLGVRPIVGLAVALALATTQAFWLQATTAEVYALNALFTALLFYIAVSGRALGQRVFLLLGLVGGLAVSHHLSMAYALAGSLVVAIVGLGLVPRPRTVLATVLLLALGLTVWLYVPIRSAREPLLTWGDTARLGGFVSHVTAQSYKWRLRSPDLAGRLLDWLGFFRVLAASSGAPLAVLAALGVAANARRWRMLAGFCLLVVLFAFHYAVYNIPDISSHVFPALVAVGVLAAAGLDGVRRWARLPARSSWVVVAVGLAILALNLAAIRPRADAHFARDYAEAVAQSAREACGENCLVVTAGEAASFPLLYTLLTGPAGGVRVYDMKISSPSAIGSSERPKTVEECAALAADRFGARGVVTLSAPPSVAGRPARICGMVYATAARGQCKSPLEYGVRGAGEDGREYSSRLLGGSYYLHLARWCVQEGDRVGAGKYLDRAVAVAWDDAATHIYASRLSQEMGLGDKAFALAEAATRLDPDFFEGHDMLANLLSARGDRSGAIKEYLEALEGNPNPAPVYSNLGNAYFSDGDLARAAAALRRALELDSTLANAYLGLGRTYEAQERVDEALRQYGLARRADPGYEPALHAEASLLLKLGRGGDAEGLLREGLARRPSSGLLLSDLGLVWLREDNLDSAIVAFERALACDPSVLAARGNLAVAYEAKGMIAEAIREYRAYAAAAPPGGSRARAEEALRRLADSAPVR
jgi:tetratricopeptide (TPR) repeat protein